jgi:hypothetical protein
MVTLTPIERGTPPAALTLATGDPTFLVSGAAGEIVRSDGDRRPREYACVLTECAGRWILFARPGSNAVKLNGVTVLGFKILRHGDEVSITGARLAFSEESPETLTAHAAPVLRGRLCPVCMDGFEAGMEVMSCPRCRTAHHFDCWTAHGCAAHPTCGYIVRSRAVPAAVPGAAVDA